MVRKSSIARISITLPREVLVAADREAKRLDRPRSWVIAEAVRQYGAGRTAATPTVAADVAAARHRHLVADLRLSPEERLRRADALVHLTPRRRTSRRAQVIGFDSYEDFSIWKQTRLIEGLPRT